jgi:hypothetical protein
LERYRVFNGTSEVGVHGCPDEHVDGALDPPHLGEMTGKAGRQVNSEVLTHQRSDGLPGLGI